jgi:hypothetical protein
MNRFGRDSGSTATSGPDVAGDRPLGFAISDTFRRRERALVMTLPLLEKLG